MRVIYSFILVFILCFAQGAFAEPKIVRIVALGDSLMSGHRISYRQSYTKVLSAYLMKEGYTQFRIDDSSVAGQASYDAVAKVKEVVGLRPDIVLLELGINDLLQGRDVQQIYKNLDYLIKTFKSKNIKMLFIGMKAPPTAPAKYQGKFEGMYKYLADHHKIPFYPFFLEDVALRPELNISDGVHPNADGVRIMVDNTGPYVVELIKWVKRDKGW